MVWCNTIHGGHGQEQDENEADLPFSLRSATREVRDYCILERIASPKALASPKDYLQTESNTEWVDGARIYKTNTSEHL